MAKRDAQKLAAGLAEQAEELARKNAREAKTQKFLKDYKINPDNWLALLGRRAASQYVLKDPLSQNVRTWDTPVTTLGQTYNDMRWLSDEAYRNELYNKIRENKKNVDPLGAQIDRETGYDFSKLSNVGGRIALGPQVIGANDETPEHEFMHRGQMEMKKGIGELVPYLYAYNNKKSLHGNSTGQATFRDMLGRDPTSGDKARLEQDLAAAKKEYERRYTSGPQGGMPYEFHPHLDVGDTPPPTPSIMDRIKNKTQNATQKLAKILSSVRLEKNP